MKKLQIKSTTRSNYITIGMVVVAFVIMYILNGAGFISNNLSGQLVPICAYICMAISLNLTVGILGELSLGHAAFMSVGAFTGVIAAVSVTYATDGAAPAWLKLIIAVVVGAVFAAIAGVIVGVPVLRLNGDYLAIVTLAFGEIVRSIINNLYIGVDAAGLHVNFTGAKDLGMNKGTIIINGAIGASSQKIATFLAGFILVMVILVVSLNIINSRTGRAIMALRDNRIAVESVGISTIKYKLMTFVVSAAMAGMAGALFALNYATVAPSKFGFNTSILILVYVVLGGIGNIRGGIIATVVLVVLPELLRVLNDYRMLIYAIVLILVMIFTNNERARDFITRPFRLFAERFFPKLVKGGKSDV